MNIELMMFGLDTKDKRIKNDWKRYLMVTKSLIKSSNLLLWNL